METETDEIKAKNGINYGMHKSQKSNITRIFILQIINLILIILLLFFILYRGKNTIFISQEYQNKQYENGANIATLSEKLKLLKLMTNNNINEYKGIQECLLNDPDNNRCIYHLISTKEVVGKNRVLLGAKYDGCYVLLDDFNDIKIAYSFGISKNIQFDKALADKGIDVYMYDHTIDSLPYENPMFHWKKIGLCGKKTKHEHLKNLEELISENGHIKEKNMILKLDIEIWEWESLIDLKEETLNQFKYICIEFHFKNATIGNNGELYYNVLKKISKTHQAFYIRCNANKNLKINFGNNRICYLLEVSYIIKEGNLFKKDDAVYPIYEFEYIGPYKIYNEMNLNLLKLFD